MGVRHLRIEQPAEALDDAKHLDSALVCSGDSSRDGGIEGGCVAAGSENGNAFHG